MRSFLPGLLRITTLALLLAAGWGAEPASATATPPAAPSATAAPFFSQEEWDGAPARTTTVSGGAVLPILGSLLAVVALAVGLGWATRRFGWKKLIPGAGGHLEVVDRVSLGRRRALLLVRCGDRLFVVGDSEAGLHGCGDMPAASVPGLSFERQLRAEQFPGLKVNGNTP